MKKLDKISKITWARLAMAIDTDGSISLTKRVRAKHIHSFQNSVKVANTDKRLLNWCKQNFGGSISNSRLSVLPRKALYNWNANSEDIKIIMEKIMPYLLIKKERAKVMIQFRNTVGDKYKHIPILFETKELRDRLYKIMKALNPPPGRSRLF